jgi:hypothetical protein
VGAALGTGPTLGQHTLVKRQRLVDLGDEIENLACRQFQMVESAHAQQSGIDVDKRTFDGRHRNAIECGDEE